MEKEPQVSNPETPKVNNVHVDHPRLTEYGRNMKKQGVHVDDAAKRLGVPRPVAEQIYRDADR